MRTAQLSSIDTLAAVTFFDLVDFTKSTEELGDRGAVQLLDEWDAVVTANVDSNRGRIVRTLGDGMLAVFHDADSAVRAAVGVLRQRVGLPSSGRGSTRVRIGIDFGPVSRRGEDYLGHTVNLATRLTKLSRPGEALAAETVKDFVGDVTGAIWRSRGQTRVRGLTSRPRAWRLSLAR